MKSTCPISSFSHALSDRLQNEVLATEQNFSLTHPHLLEEEGPALLEISNSEQISKGTDVVHDSSHTQPRSDLDVKAHENSRK